MVTAAIAKSMDIELLSADQSLCGHQISMQEEKIVHTITIGTTTQGKVTLLLLRVWTYTSELH